MWLCFDLLKKQRIFNNVISCKKKKKIKKQKFALSASQEANERTAYVACMHVYDDICMYGSVYD